MVVEAVVLVNRRKENSTMTGLIAAQDSFSRPLEKRTLNANLNSIDFFL